MRVGFEGEAIDGDIYLFVLRYPYFIFGFGTGVIVARTLIVFVADRLLGGLAGFQYDVFFSTAFFRALWFFDCFNIEYFVWFRFCERVSACWHRADRAGCRSTVGYVCYAN